MSPSTPPDNTHRPPTTVDISPGTDRHGEEHPLETIFSPTRVVVAGASNNILRMGSIQALNIINGGFAGQVAFIHPRESTVLERPAYQDPRDLPFVPDVALLTTPTKVTVPLLDGLGERGLRHAIITTAGFRERGTADGAALEAELLQTARRHGIRFVGPNCIGIINAHARFNTTIFPYELGPGPLGLASQSGTYVTQSLPWLARRGIRYSKAISVGNSTSIDLADCLEYFGDDDDTKAIALYIEGLRDPGRFLKVARAVTPHKPVVALYVGGTETGARAGQSHTGNLGAPDHLYDGLLAQAGIVRAHTIDELYGIGWTMATMPAPRAPRVAIMTHSGGPASSMADACEREGLELPVLSDELQAALVRHVPATASVKNPIDVTFDLDATPLTKHIPELLFASDEVDGILVHGLMDTGFAHLVHRAAGDFMPMTREQLMDFVRFDLSPLLELPARYHKPLVASTFIDDDHVTETFIAHDVPVFDHPEAAVKALAALAERTRLRDELEGYAQAPWTPTSPTLPPLLDAAGLIDDVTAFALLDSVGIPVAPYDVATSLAEAEEIALRWGYPVVLKGLVPGVAHKSDQGLVQTGIRDAQGLARAWEAIEGNGPGAPRLVMRQIRGERELAVGALRHPSFGPAVMLGLGGRFLEALGDTTFRIPPLSPPEGAAMLDALSSRGLFGAFRDLPAVDRDSLGRIISAVGQLMLAEPRITAIDCNPLIVEGSTPMVVDALITLEAPRA